MATLVNLAFAVLTACVFAFVVYGPEERHAVFGKHAQCYPRDDPDVSIYLSIFYLLVPCNFGEAGNHEAGNHQLTAAAALRGSPNEEWPLYVILFTLVKHFIPNTPRVLYFTV